MAPMGRDSVGSGSLREHGYASSGGNNVRRYHPYRSSPSRARHSRLSGNADAATPPTRSTSSAARPISWFPGDDVGGLSGPRSISDYMRGVPWADLDRTGRGSGGYASWSNAGPGFTGPSVYDHPRETVAGSSRAYLPPRDSYSTPRLPALEEELPGYERRPEDTDFDDRYVSQECYWNAEPAPAGRIAGHSGVHAGPRQSAFRKRLERPSGGGHAIPRKPVPGPAVSGYEPHVRQPEAEVFYPHPRWPAADGPGLVRRPAIRRLMPSEGMKRREELHRHREEVRRRRRSSDRGVMPEGTGSGASSREASRPPPKKRVRFASVVERFSRGW